MKITLAVFTAILLFGVITAPAAAADVTTISSLEDLEQFRESVNNGSADYTGTTVTLTADIDLGQKYNASHSLNWMPIGSDGHQFNGTFNGGNNIISNLYINNVSGDCQGLFGETGSGAVIQNLGLTGVNVTGNIYVGSIVGLNNGIVNNSYSTGNVSGTNYIGGAVGQNENGGLIQNCYSLCTVSGTFNGIGGVVGYNEGIIENCYSTGAINGADHVGGLVGMNQGGTLSNSLALNPSVSGSSIGRVAGLNSGSGSEINNCYAWANMTNGTNQLPSGAANDINGTSASQSNIWANITFYNSVFGSANINIDGTKLWNISRSDEDETVWGLPWLTSLGKPSESSGIAYLKPFVVTFNPNNNTASWKVPVFNGSNVSKPTPDPTKSGYNFTGWNLSTGGAFDFSTLIKSDIELVANYTKDVYHNVTFNPNNESDVWKVTVFNGSNVPKPSPDPIKSGYTFVGWNNSTGVAFNFNDKITADITLIANYSKDPAPSAVFDGYGNATSPFLINTAADLKNLSRVVNNGEKYDGKNYSDAHYNLTNNIDLQGTDTNQWTPIGSSDNKFNGTFNGSWYTISNIYINNSAGYQGLFGHTGSGTLIQNFGVSNVNISCSGDSGALVGDNSGTITNCYANGTVISTGDHVGGLIGYNNGKITNCSATVKVSGDDCVGGLAGYNYAVSTIGAAEAMAIIIDCYATGDVRGSSYVGGLIGKNYAESTTGAAEARAIITGCYATGVVSGNFWVGGFAGQNYAKSSNDAAEAIITDCYATGAVSGGNLVGGFAGQNYQNGGKAAAEIKGCYARGAVLGTGESIGGFTGLNSGGTITNCYAAGTVSGVHKIGGLIGWNSGTITKCYAVGTVSGVHNIGGLIGYNAGGNRLQNSIALNPSVGGSTNVGRVFGVDENSGDRVVNCYAWEKMTNNGVLFPEGGSNGISVSSADVWANLNFWQSDKKLNWDSEISSDDSAVWKIKSGGMNAKGFGVPYLKKIGEPSAAEAAVLSHLIPPPQPQEVKFDDSSDQISPPTGYVPIGDGGTAIVVIGTGGTTGNPVITPISPNSDIIKNVAEYLKTDDADVRGAFDLSGMSISEGGTARINIETILNNGEKAEYLKLIHGLSGGTFEELPITITNQNGNQITGYATTTSTSPFILVYEEGGAVNTTEPTKTQTAAPTAAKTEKPAVTVTETAAVNTTAEPTAKAESPIGLVWLAAGLLGAVIVLRRK